MSKLVISCLVFHILSNGIEIRDADTYLELIHRGFDDDSTTLECLSFLEFVKAEKSRIDFDFEMFEDGFFELGNEIEFSFVETFRRRQQ